MFGNRLNLYTVHVKPEDAGSEKLPVFVSEGFSLYAFIMTGFWLLYHKIWLPLVWVLMFNVALGFLMEFQVIHPTSSVLLSLVFQLWIGFEANDWRRARLKKEGYVMHAMVSGTSEMQAEQRYFDRLVAAQS